MDNFKCCPFCGSNEISLETHTPSAMAGSIITYAYVKCRKCKAQGPRTNDWENKLNISFVIDAWNIRK